MSRVRRLNSSESGNGNILAKNLAESNTTIDGINDWSVAQLKLLFKKVYKGTSNKLSW